MEDVLDYYADQAMPQVGNRLVAEVIADIELRLSQPRLGRMVPEFEQNFLLELIRPLSGLSIAWTQEQIRIVRVWRSERLLKLPQDGSGA